MKQLFLLIKNQWKFIKKYGIIQEFVRIRRRTAWFIKNVMFKSDFREKAREDIKIIKKVFKEKEVQFFLLFGTCLGAVREGDFIQWDDDVDLGIIEKTPPKTREEISEALRKEGFKIVEYQNYQQCSAIMCKRKIKTSICWFQKEGESFVWRDRKIKGNIEVQVPAELFERFREANLGEEKFLVPDPPEIYLEKIYGDWKTPQKRGFTRLIVEK